MPCNPPDAPDPYKHPMQYAAHERAHGRQVPAWINDMESTSRLREQRDEANEYVETLLAERDRLRAENEELQREVESLENKVRSWQREMHVQQLKRVAAEATMREVAEELRAIAPWHKGSKILALADRLDPPPVVENPPA